jgi:hypothetical protein
MSPRWLRASAAALLVACAAPAPEPPPPEPAATVSPERQRFENWKQAEPSGDPRPDFERDAAAEAERRRREALEAGVPRD